MKKTEEAKLVYSTDDGGICRECGKKQRKCGCRKKENRAAPGDGVVRIGRQTKGRKGNGVSTVQGLPLQEKELVVLAAQLKKRCGCGGTVKNGTIEIQGDQRKELAAFLSQHGYKVKLAGS
ncbi:MAG: stress response translation initiation inhibitor YciH [Desulfopila sp.]|nr:stress response translation initiation inhibitor YciH [Desulfopila sp.]